MPDVRLTVRRAVLLIVCSLLVFGGFVLVGSGGVLAEPIDGYVDGGATTPNLAVQEAEEPIEEAYEQPVPERGDPYFEAEADDGSWISYLNPRDEYRSPYLGDGSAKMCVVLVNEEGDPVVGESVPNTTATLPTGDSVEWHSRADPITVQYPLTDHYDRPLDADQFGTSSDLPQGDGYLDSHCYEFHGLPEDGTVEYGEVEVEGEHADWIEVVGYIQQDNDAWDTDTDPLAAAEPYEQAGGGWTYETAETDSTHGQVVAVLQLDPPADAYEASNSSSEENSGSENGDTNSTDGEGTDEGTSDEEREGDVVPGFGVPVALVALVSLVFLLARR